MQFLNDHERAQLRVQHKRERDGRIRDRIKAVLLYDGGWTPQQIAERIVAYKAVGVDLILSGFLHFQEEVAYFGEKVLPLVRELEAQQGIASDAQPAQAA